MIIQWKTLLTDKDKPLLAKAVFGKKLDDKMFRTMLENWMKANHGDGWNGHTYKLY